ncbi:hypothetical protein RM780_24210 [Streptomyces sp. DSM 44917]|uniref:DUF302 domain-containing protein n=1 Tax=Streptomyces boetiae TaxID=3075541 RepID=A0ABU2LEM0_9ACTN|nr:hypothetical protein [Streptomyces sp. DSM 44917]MDT0310034.1 hypothetical protein [Streptomyces sp. DSM 44917]
MAGESGHEVATELAARCDGEPGPVIGELLGERWLYFVLPPGTVASYGWPSLAQVYAAPPVDTVTWMGVPALSGDTWPLFWFARPTLERPFVEARMLHQIVREVAGRDA